MARISTAFLIVLGALLAVLGLKTVASAEGPIPLEDVKGACGGDGEPECPMEGWMEENVGKPMKAKDFKAVAVGLHKAEFLSPDPKWDEGPKGWARLSRDGAVAAEKGDAEGVKASCKGCHTAWRDKYKATFKKQVLPKFPANAEKGRKDIK